MTIKPTTWRRATYDELLAEIERLSRLQQPDRPTDAEVLRYGADARDRDAAIQRRGTK